MEGDRGPGFGVGLLTGAVVGAGLALALAPWSVEGTRDVLRARAREASNRAKDAVADIGDQARSAAADGAETVGHLYAAGAERLDGVRRNLGAAAEEGQHAAAEHRAQLTERYLEETSPG